MLISGIRCSKTHLGTRWQADVTWEDSNEGTHTLELSSTELTPDHAPNEFFVLNMLPNALARRQKRLQIEGDLHPELHAGTTVAALALSAWFCRGRRIPDLISGSRARGESTRDRGCGMFLSGGADSLALLLYLSRHYPSGHPMRPTHAYFVHGMDIGPKGDITSSAAFFEKARTSLEPICRQLGVKLVSVHTNLRKRGLSRSSWPKLHFGMAMAGIAHAFSHQIAHMYIASAFSVRIASPKAGSHPLVEPSCSTSDMRIHLGLQHMTRFDRIALLAEEPHALACLRVCWQHIENDGPLNCSRCHKCVLTMLGLIACGKLKDCATFEFDDVTPEVVRATLFTHQASSMLLYSELLDPLARVGRTDLVDALEEKIRQTRHRLSLPGRAWARMAKAARKVVGK